MLTIILTSYFRFSTWQVLSVASAEYPFLLLWSVIDDPHLILWNILYYFIYAAAGRHSYPRRYSHEFPFLLSLHAQSPAMEEVSEQQKPLLSIPSAHSSLLKLFRHFHSLSDWQCVSTNFAAHHTSSCDTKASSESGSNRTCIKFRRRPCSPNSFHATPTPFAYPRIGQARSFRDVLSANNFVSNKPKFPMDHSCRPQLESRTSSKYDEITWRTTEFHFHGEQLQPLWI